MSVCLQEEAPCSDNKPWPSEMKPWNTKERTFVYILTVENAQFFENGFWNQAKLRQTNAELILNSEKCFALI